MPAARLEGLVTIVLSDGDPLGHPSRVEGLIAIVLHDDTIAPPPPASGGTTLAPTSLAPKELAPSLSPSKLATS